VKSVLALLTIELVFSLAGCSFRQSAIGSTDKSGAPAEQAKVPQTQQKNWGEPVYGLRSSIDIEPVADTTPRHLSLTLQNASGAEISFRPFISLHLTADSDENSFWAPADITMPKSNFPKRSFPQPPNGQPMISLAAGESRTLSFPLEDLGWDRFKSSYYRGESFYTIVPAGKYDLVAAIELREGQMKTNGDTVKIPKGSHIRSGKIKLQVNVEDSRKTIVVGN
jgi:hypothetical protein